MAKNQQPMFELPLFPLGTVLFPGIPINLHVFEERYKAMINRCLRKNEPFGVVLIREGVEAYGPLAKPHPVGCTALIAGVQMLEQGRMLIVASGHERFRISSLSFDRPYLTAAVELLPLANTDDPLNLQRQGRQLSLLLRRYLELVVQTGGAEFKPEQMPADPVQLAYWSAAILQHVAQAKKQDLLAQGSARALLTQVSALYRREVSLLEMMLDRHSAGQENNPFSLN